MLLSDAVREWIMSTSELSESIQQISLFLFSLFFFIYLAYVDSSLELYKDHFLHKQQVIAWVEMNDS